MKIKLYFCSECGILIGKDNPSDDEEGECPNCANEFANQPCVEGEFENDAAETLLTTV